MQNALPLHPHILLLLRRRSTRVLLVRAKNAYNALMDSIQRALVEALQNQTQAAVATVVKTLGSSPRDVGAKMFVYPDGKIVGHGL